MTVLHDVVIDGVVSVLIGQNADPTEGDPVYHMLTIQQMYQTAAEYGSVIPFSAKFANRGNLAGWGVSLTAPVTITDSTTGNAINNGSASSNGGAVFLHILETTLTDTYTILVEGSADGVTGWGQVAAFTLDGLALDSERVPMSGAIPQYLRFRATRSGTAADDLRLAVSIVRF